MRSRFFFFAERRFEKENWIFPRQQQRQREEGGEEKKEAAKNLKNALRGSAPLACSSFQFETTSGLACRRARAQEWRRCARRKRSRGRAAVFFSNGGRRRVGGAREEVCFFFFSTSTLSAISLSLSLSLSRFLSRLNPSSSLCLLDTHLRPGGPRRFLKRRGGRPRAPRRPSVVLEPSQSASLPLALGQQRAQKKQPPGATLFRSFPLGGGGACPLSLSLS